MLEKKPTLIGENKVISLIIVLIERNIDIIPKKYRINFRINL
jgi:hypothetical protein